MAPEEDFNCLRRASGALVIDASGGVPSAYSSLFSRDRSVLDCSTIPTNEMAGTRIATDVLPTPYYVFFSIVEPLLTYLGAAYAIFTPSEYFVSLFPPSLQIPPKLAAIHPASIMATRQLGSCFLLFALMGSILLPRVRNVLAGKPKELESFVEAYLGCLALADLTHIGFTLFDLGAEGTLNPHLHWHQLVLGNVVITTGLFVVRVMWFAGIGRASHRIAKTE